MTNSLIFFARSKFFKYSEFNSPDLENSGLNMNTLFLYKLEKARIHSKIPYIIISGYRTKKHNKKIKGVYNSSHLKGLASDIKYNNTRECFTIINSLLHVGFTRIGVNRSSIHVDDDNTKPKKVFWTYYN